MSGPEVVISCVVGWAAHIPRRGGRPADTEADRALDAGMQRVHDLVTARLEEEPRFRLLWAEIEAGGAPAGETLDAAARALGAASDDDPEFAARLHTLMEEVEQLRCAAGAPALHVAGDLNVRAGGSSVGCV